MIPKPDEMLFALKTFAGAMAAFYLACWLGLDKPFWAMTSAYIVAQPLTGAMRSKAVFRFIGTMIGSTAAVVMVPSLVNAPVLLCLAMAGWIGGCLYLSLLDRSPRSYTFILAGYTAAIIGFPSVTDPNMIFQTALTRVEEIVIGITCTTFLGAIVFPRPMGPVIARRIARWVPPTNDWAVASLVGKDEDAQTRAARYRLAVEVNDVGLLTTQLAFDTSPLQAAVPYIKRLRIYMLSLMPVASSIGDRVAELRRMNGITPALQEVLEAMSGWVQVGEPGNADAVRARIGALAESGTSWAGLLRASLAVRLNELITIMRHTRAIRQHIVNGAPPPKNAVLDGEHVAAAVRLHDHGMVFLSSLAAFLAVLLVCAFWINADWPGGANAALMAAIVCCLFATQDDPAPALAQMLRNVMIVVIVIGFYTFVILPRVETFVELALALSPIGLIIGVLISRPSTAGIGLAVVAFGPTNLALENGYVGDFAGYLNNAASLVFGVAAALVVTKLSCSVGAEWSIRRLLRAGWRDIAAAAEAQGPQDRAVLTGRMMDRLGLLMPRLAAVSEDGDIVAANVLRDMRVGWNVIGREKVAALMRRMGIEAVYRRPNTSKPAPGHKVYPYLLRGMLIDRPNQVWAMDITYIPMARGFVYLAAVVDWFSRRVLAWKLSITLQVEFCMGVVEEALARYGKPKIFNTDQGSQFTSGDFTGLLLEHKIAISMDGKAAWRDNVFVERLWRSVKHEEVYLHTYASVAEARAGLGRYLNFYNGRRPHSSLGARTPDRVYFTQAPLLAAA